MLTKTGQKPYLHNKELWVLCSVYHSTTYIDISFNHKICTPWTWKIKSEKKNDQTVIMLLWTEWNFTHQIIIKLILGVPKCNVLI